MNKRQSKKQKRLEAVRLLEKMREYECAALIKERDGSWSMVILRDVSVTMEQWRPEPHAVLYVNATIEGSVADVVTGV